MSKFSRELFARRAAKAVENASESFSFCYCIFSGEKFFLAFLRNECGDRFVLCVQVKCECASVKVASFILC